MRVRTMINSVPAVFLGLLASMILFSCTKEYKEKLEQQQNVSYAIKSNGIPETPDYTYMLARGVLETPPSGNTFFLKPAPGDRCLLTLYRDGSNNFNGVTAAHCLIDHTTFQKKQHLILWRYKFRRDEANLEDIAYWSPVGYLDDLTSSSCVNPNFSAFFEDYAGEMVVNEIKQKAVRSEAILAGNDVAFVAFNEKIKDHLKLSDFNVLPTILPEVFNSSDAENPRQEFLKEYEEFSGLDRKTGLKAYITKFEDIESISRTNDLQQVYIDYVFARGVLTSTMNNLHVRNRLAKGDSGGPLLYDIRVVEEHTGEEHTAKTIIGINAMYGTKFDSLNPDEYENMAGVSIFASLFDDSNYNTYKAFKAGGCELGTAGPRPFQELYLSSGGADPHSGAAFNLAGTIVPNQKWILEAYRSDIESLDPNDTKIKPSYARFLVNRIDDPDWSGNPGTSTIVYTGAIPQASSPEPANSPMGSGPIEIDKDSATGEVIAQSDGNGSPSADPAPSCDANRGQCPDQKILKINNTCTGNLVNLGLTGAFEGTYFFAPAHCFPAITGVDSIRTQICPSADAIYSQVDFDQQEQISCHSDNVFIYSPSSKLDVIGFKANIDHGAAGGNNAMKKFAAPLAEQADKNKLLIGSVYELDSFAPSIQRENKVPENATNRICSSGPYANYHICHTLGRQAGKSGMLLLSPEGRAVCMHIGLSTTTTSNACFDFTKLKSDIAGSNLDSSKITVQNGAGSSGGTSSGETGEDGQPEQPAQAPRQHQGGGNDVEQPVVIVEIDSNSGDGAGEDSSATVPQSLESIDGYANCATLNLSEKIDEYLSQARSSCSQQDGFPAKCLSGIGQGPNGESYCTLRDGASYQPTSVLSSNSECAQISGFICGNSILPHLDMSVWIKFKPSSNATEVLLRIE